MNKGLRLVFFGNYFVGLLAIALNLEASAQLGMPYNSLRYYALLFMLPVVYYTYAYQRQSVGVQKSDPRSNWYARHRKFVRYSQITLTVSSAILAVSLLISYHDHILRLPVTDWLLFITLALAAALYYGLLPGNLNLRKVGWLKAFVIGFVWAGCANVAPLVMVHIEQGNVSPDSMFWLFLFVKNWMFCTVNAIIFDIKDYPTDANRQLKTFVVRFGLRRTIFSILVPLLCVGLLSLLCFAFFKNFEPVRVAINCLPFLVMIWAAYAMRKRHNLVYYLVLIDGALLFKAFCGIVAANLTI